MRETTSGEEATAHGIRVRALVPLRSRRGDDLTTARMYSKAIAAGLLVLATGPVRAEGEAGGDGTAVAPVLVAPIDVRATREDGETRARAADRALEEPAFVTVVRTDDRAGETTTVAEILAESVGVRTRSLGGLGGFASISVRGTDDGHTAILVDGVPLSQIAGAGTDLGLFTLQSFSTIEMYRGGAPSGFGGSTLGGAVNLRTRPADNIGASIEAGVGSFGARHLAGRWGTELGAEHAVSTWLGYRGADGDYTFFDDNGTNLTTDDDRFATRSNNGFDHLDGVARYAYDGGRTRADAGTRVAWRAQGMPGPGNVQTRSTSLETLRLLADAKLRHTGSIGRSALTADGTLFVLAERQRYEDPAGELGLAQQHTVHRILSTGAQGQLSWVLLPAQIWSVGGEVRVDDFIAEDVLHPDDPDARGRRIGGAFTFTDEVSLDDDRILVQAAIRLDLQHTAPVDAMAGPIGGSTPLTARSDIHPSPRISSRVRVLPWLSAKGNAGWYFRPPTVYELFGDRGFVVGNGELEPETGVAADAGLIVAPEEGILSLDQLYLETAFFRIRSNDSIVFVPVAGMVAKPFNLDDADLAGLEGVFRGRVAQHLKLIGNYTYLHTQQISSQSSYDGKRLPHRPAHQAYTRIELEGSAFGHRASTWVDAHYVSSNFLDRGNFATTPSRTLLGYGLKLAISSSLTLGFEMKNILNQRTQPVPLRPPPRPDLDKVPSAVADYLGYPLPGRALYLTLTWTDSAHANRTGPSK